MTATGGPGAAVLAVALLLAAALLAAGVNGVLSARAAGGPVGGGLLVPFAEVARLVRQRRRTTLAADRLLWRIGGVGLVVVPLLMVAVVPFGATALFDSAVGVVWFNTADVAIWALVWLLGWGANSAYGLVGGYRFLAGALAYELPLMFAITAPAVGAQSLRVGDVVAAQHGLWFVVWMPVAFVVMCMGIVGFSIWGPLSPGAAADIGGGVLAELSGPDRLVVQAGRYLLLAAGSAVAVCLFLGGGSGPLLPAWLWLLVKTVALLVVLVVLRRRLPLLRPDRFLEVGWLVLLPAALLQLLVVSVVVARGR